MATYNVNSNERVFLISRQGFIGSKNIFCNLEDIPEVLKNELEVNDEYTISHFWNSKFKKATKKYMNEMFIANQIEFKIK